MIVAQLSDIHADGYQPALDRLDRVLAWLKPIQPDAIIISGDLAEDAHDDSYGAIQDRLAATGARIGVVPGNVDDHAALHRSFGASMGWSGVRPLHSVVHVGNEMRLVGLDVTVAGGHHGDATPALAWLQAELAADGAPVLIYQHQHPFLCGIDGKDRNICRNGVGLAEIIKAAPSRVLALTCGHVHRAMFTRFAERSATMAPSIAPANHLRVDGKASLSMDPPGLLIHHWQDDRLVSHVVSVAD